MKEPLPIWRQQSPIDLVMEASLPAVFPRDYLIIDYPNAKLDGHFEKHDFWIAKSARPRVLLGGREAFLQRLHIHSPSEHRLDGKCFDFEIHFVNPFADKNGDSKAVVMGVFFKEKKGAKTPPSIQALNAAVGAGLEQKAEKIPGTVNPSEFLPMNRAQFFRYEGSLTTPGIRPDHQLDRIPADD